VTRRSACTPSTCSNAAERRTVLETWNATATPVPAVTVPELFAAQAARTPAATAVISDGTHLTYADLDTRANRLARHLTGRGVGPETVVAVDVPRGADLLVALLGVLKAGGAYFAIDASYPRNGCRTCAPTPARRRSSHSRPSRRRPARTAAPSTRPAATGAPRLHDLHLRLHRRPKGVVVTHAAFVNLTVAHARFGTGPGAVVAQFASAGLTTSAPSGPWRCCAARPSPSSPTRPGSAPTWNDS